MISREEMIRRGKQMDTLEYKPVTLKEYKPYWEPLPIMIPNPEGFSYSPHPYLNAPPAPPVLYPLSHFYPDVKPVSFRLPTNDKLPYGYKEFALPDLLSQELGYKEGWYDMTWEEGHHDHSKELEYYRDPSKEKPHFEVQIAGPEDYPSLRMAEASMSSTLSTSMKE